ncbi:hypothetical protein PPYR_13772 [Photinus pyralis]|uniref:Amidase domain-containing protein n=1 Tax=Photinus pyralis TaxID=7054 RepID=A0A1Y1KK56_PHOPY|nr:fatty-acid amide hydrolase 2 [Photinus pyralis]KAB0794152.1 hypothetical protein PPYR_13772 [Photinus pyralis]
MCTPAVKQRPNRTTCKKIKSLLLEVFVFVRIYLDRLIDFVFGCYYKSRVQIVPKPSNPIVIESATALAKRIREQNLTSEALVRACIDRIKQVNPLINAVVDERFEDALAEAKQLDERIRNGAVSSEEFAEKPFLGVPFSTKESSACKGMRSTYGLVCRKDKRAEEDAEAVRLVKNAGGILIAITNIPVLNMWQETDNRVYGRTNNPYNTTRDVGGSSGGEGAIIAACGVPFGIGTDIGGSIRIPAFKCGIFGHKPTGELIQTRGLTYRTGKEPSTIMSAGTLTRSSSDIIPFLKVLLDKNVNRLQLDKQVNVKDLKVHYMLSSGDSKMSLLTREMTAAILKVVKHFEVDLKASPKKLIVPELKYGMALWRYWLTQEANANFARDLTDRKGQVSPIWEVLKWVFQCSEFNSGAIFNLIGTYLPLMNEKKARDLTKQLKDSLMDALGDNGVLIYPSAPWSARYHNTSLLRPYNFGYFAVWNLLKFPVTQVPLGLDSEGLPIGVQVVAAPYQDHLCIAVARELESAFGGFVPPFSS